jgi:soluble lytic murein transglycosylase-like protein
LTWVLLAGVAVSPVGALGLTQLMPATARSLQPGLSRDDIFDRDTNLHLGFRYLHGLLRAYPGRVDLALHAYNRGPGTVDRIRAAGGDPANGYATAVLGSGADAYRGSGLLGRSSAVGLRSSVLYSDSSDALPPTED